MKGDLGIGTYHPVWDRQKNLGLDAYGKLG